MQHPDDSATKLIEEEAGARLGSGLTNKAIIFIALAWAVFQLWYASPWSLVSSSAARPLHLVFAIFLAFLVYPAFKKSSLNKVPWYDWLLALLGAASAYYLVFAYEALSTRPGLPTTTDMIFSGMGMILLLEATRRALGPPLMLVATVFLLYTFLGPYFPEVISHRGASLERLLSHQWLTAEGVFGVAIGVSVSFVFLFVLFGALLEKAGAGNYFIKVAFAFLGHLRGGPAKAAVVASGLSGLVSGSSIANVVTTGTFTIPLMKRVGFPAHKAGAVEVAASTNGQLTPPIMGAAAFLMVEYVGISYLEVIKHAILPALISYIALFYIVHLEACKAGMQPLVNKKPNKLTLSLLNLAGAVLVLSLLTFAIYYGLGWIKTAFGAASGWIIFVLLVASYLALLAYACRYPELEKDDPNSELLEMPEAAPTVKSGLYFLLPVVVLIWCLAVERFSPGLSVFWAVLFMMFIVITQKPLKTWLRKANTGYLASFKEGLDDLFSGVVSGSRNMIAIGVATAAAGIIVGTVTLTGIGLVMTDFVQFISGGNLVLALVFTALISLILGMGLPTTANYIVVSTLMAPVMVEIAALNGLLVPLIAIHMFVFYYGIMADITPPVGLAAFAAAAVARADPVKTGIQGFTYDMRTAVLPFMFVFNTQLLLIDIENWLHLIITVFSALVAMLVFAAATQGWWLVKSRRWESLLMLVITFCLFRPDFIQDRIFAPIQSHEAAAVYEQADKLAAGEDFHLWFTGEALDGKEFTKLFVLKLGEGATGEERLAAAGLELAEIDEGQLEVDLVGFASTAEKLGIEYGWQLAKVDERLPQPAKEWFLIPPFALLALLAWLQLKRREPKGAASLG